MREIFFFFGAKYRQNQVFAELGLIQQHFFSEKKRFSKTVRGLSNLNGFVLEYI